MSQEKIKSMVDNIINGNNLESESDFKNVMLFYVCFCNLNFINYYREIRK